MKEEFLRFSLDTEPPKSEGGKKETDFFSKDFEAPTPFISLPLVLGEGQGVAGEETPRRVGQVPEGGFGARAPVSLGAFRREDPLLGQQVQALQLEEPTLVGSVSFEESGVAGEEGVRPWGQASLGGEAPRGPAGLQAFFVPRPFVGEAVVTAESEPIVEQPVEFRATGVAGESESREAQLEQPYSAVEQALIVDGDCDRMTRKPRKRRRRGKKLPLKC